MKQTNHAPQPLWRRRLPGYAAMGAAKLEGAIFEVDSDTGLCRDVRPVRLR